MRVSIGAKIIGLVVASVVATVVLIQCVAFYAVRDGFEKVATQTVEGDCRVFEREIAIYKEKYLNLARAQALREFVRRGIETGDSADLRQLGRTLLREQDLDLVVFAGPDGKVVARGQSDSVGDTIDNQEGVKRALAGQASCLLESGNLVGFSIRAYAPVKKGDAVAGVVIVGQDLTKNSNLVDGIKHNLGVEATIFSGATRVSTTIEENGHRAVGTRLANAGIVESVLHQGKTYYGANRIFGRDYRTVYVPLKNGDAIVGMGFVGIDMTNMLAARDGIIRFIGLAGLACMAVFVSLSLLLSRKITRPLLHCVRFARAVSKGEVADTLDVARQDETGTLAQALTAMAADIQVRMDEVAQARQTAENEAAQARIEREKADDACRLAENARVEGMLHAAGRVEGAVEVVNAASEQLAAQVEQAHRGAEDQSRRASEAATSMEQLNATVLDVAKSASQAAETTDQAKNQAEQGAVVVGQVVAGISGIAEQSHRLKEDMTDLGQRAKSIGAIMEVISDIADQTNLLALNAAIEAARAGEAGRGFAVVADEVRKLAEKTMDATREVGSAIQGIQDSTRNNVAGFDDAVQHVEAATALARRSGDALDSIVTLVEAAADQVRSIATAAEEQSAASEEIGRTVDAINTISGQTAQVMAQAATAVGELADQSKKLQALVAEMQNNGEAPALAAGRQ